MNNGLSEHLSRFIECQETLRPRDLGIRLFRIGGDSDGAYLVPDDLKGIAACFSPGCCNTKRFEDSLLTDFGIRSHLCDFTSDIEKFSTPFSPGLQTFEKKWLAPRPCTDSLSLDEWVDKYEANTADLLLQMDIEGAEFANLQDVSDRVLKRFRILIVEFHISESNLQDKTKCSQICDVFEKLANDFICVHMHPNNCCGDYEIGDSGIRIPRVFECTFLRKDRTGDLSKEWPLATLPHPMDISHNVRHNAPLFAGNHWGSDVVTSESVRKMVEIAVADGLFRQAELREKISELESQLQSTRRLVGELNIPIKIIRRMKRIVAFFRRR